MIAINLTIIVSFILVLIMFVGIARRSKFLNKVFFPLFIFILVFGLMIYGYGYALKEPLVFTAVVRTALQVVAMFTGSSNYDVVKDTPVFSTLPGQFVFWTVHLLAFYMTASAVLSTIGSTLLLKNRGIILRFRRNEIDVIYGSDAKALQHAKALLEQNPETMIVFADDKAVDDYSSFIDKLGFVLLDPTSPLFEKALGLKRKKNIQLYCINSSEQNNIQFANRFSGFLANANRKAFLTIRCSEKALDETLRAHKQYYTSIFTFSETELTARLATKEANFVKKMKFNEVGVAQNNLHIVIVGFGTLGQQVFADTIRNTQFEGCMPHYYIIDKDLNDLSGPFAYQYKSLFDQYDIVLISEDCRSDAATNILRDVYNSIDFVFLCVGDEITNKSLAHVWHELVNSNCTVIQCVNNVVRNIEDMAEPKYLYGSDILITKEIDNRAMRVNQVYSGINDAVSAWNGTDSFSRQSSRAMADFVDAYLYILNQVPEKNDEVIENLAKTEHLRWCAFHYTRGYQMMTKETIIQRAQMHNKEMEEKGQSDIRISVDHKQKLHACLVPWDKLDEVSQLITEVTGTKVDYKEMDRQNVRSIEYFTAPISTDKEFVSDLKLNLLEFFQI